MHTKELQTEAVCFLNVGGGTRAVVVVSNKLLVSPMDGLFSHKVLYIHRVYATWIWDLTHRSTPGCLGVRTAAFVLLGPLDPARIVASVETSSVVRTHEQCRSCPRSQPLHIFSSVFPFCGRSALYLIPYV